MPAKAPKSETSALALQTAAEPRQPFKPVSDTLGQAGSKDAMARLLSAMSELKALAVQPLLQRAADAINADRPHEGTEWALKALERDEHNGFSWYVLAIARERAGDFASSITAYESALKLLPDHAEVAGDLGRLAYRMGMKEAAEKLFRHFLARYPGHHEASNNLACVLRDLELYDEAIEFLRPAILERPDIPMLWNTMGSIVAEKGDLVNAEIFYREAIRLKPDLAMALYNLGNARLCLGDTEDALALCEQALQHVTTEDSRQMMLMSRATSLLALGRIGEGWDTYEARLHPQYGDVTHFMVAAPPWRPSLDVAGKSMLVVAEQGLGDEILFANVIPSVLEALGPEGRLTIAVEPRLVGLFQRSFPTATIGSHATRARAGRTYRILPFIEDFSGFDCWSPMASLLRGMRRTLEDFPSQPGYIKPDPARVEHWRRVLQDAPPGLKVGLLWKSNITKHARHRFFSPFQDWAPVLATPGVSFINLQYGDCTAELEQAEREFGVRIWTPPGIDLKHDLDDVTALCQALDLVLGFSNASFNLGAAAGAPAWLISTPGAWTMLGTDRYPWYPQARVFVGDVLGEWTKVMAEVAEELDAFVKGAER